MRFKGINIFILILLLLSASVFPGKASANESVIDVAKQYIGTPYKYGGTTPAGFDCSGFVQFSYKQVGINVPRATTSQWVVGKSISRDNLQPGDIVFFSGTYRSGISHDGIYVGNNQFIHSSNSGVIITSLDTAYWAPKYAGARRVTNGLVAVKADVSTTKSEKKKPVVAQNVSIVKPKPEKTIVITKAKQYLYTLKNIELENDSFEVMISNQDFMQEIVFSETELFGADRVIFVNPKDETEDIPQAFLDLLQDENIKVEEMNYEQANEEKLLDKVGKKNYSFMFYGDKMPETLEDTVIANKFDDLTMMLRKYGMMNSGMLNLMQTDKTMYYTVIRDVTLEALY